MQVTPVLPSELSDGITRQSAIQSESMPLLSAKRVESEVIPQPGSLPVFLIVMPMSLYHRFRCFTGSWAFRKNLTFDLIYSHI